jgi:preprotein translocase subunit SecE
MDQLVGVQLGAAGAVLILGCWMSYRAVNMPRFADFLIAVEAEMNKVSWPSRGELFRSSVVVIVTMFGLAATLYFYDLLWQMLLTKLGVLRG